MSYGIVLVRVRVRVRRAGLGCADFHAPATPPSPAEAPFASSGACFATQASPILKTSKVLRVFPRTVPWHSGRVAPRNPRQTLLAASRRCLDSTKNKQPNDRGSYFLTRNFLSQLQKLICRINRQAPFGPGLFFGSKVPFSFLIFRVKLAFFEQKCRALRGKTRRRGLEPPFL